MQMHELYCAGHLMEAAVAVWECLGRRDLLDALCRYADYIDTVFGPEEDKLKGYPGHQEIELALVKLYRATGEERYLNLSKFFLDQRGTAPHYFDVEAEKRGEAPLSRNAMPWGKYAGFARFQAHKPVREQTEVVGHAVRAMYMYAGMADVAAETGDEELMNAVRTLWKNFTGRRMYITGGVGSSHHGESFTFDYDLPNEQAYAETCAAIGMVFWAHRMLHADLNAEYSHAEYSVAEYSDAMERALYNGIPSGVGLDGRSFMYVNPLAHKPGRIEWLHEPRREGKRQEWFSTSCCPPNIARLFASLGSYAWSTSDDTVAVHLYLGGTLTHSVGGTDVVIKQTTNYPWDETVTLSVAPAAPCEFALSVRIPGWCRNPALSVNGEAVDLSSTVKKGYATIRREWRPGDTVTLNLPMPVEVIEAHPSVRANAGRVALMRGPMVYCFEETDNGPDLNALSICAEGELTAGFEPDLLGGIYTITANGKRETTDGWDDALYRPAGATKTDNVTLKAVPYCLWTNREHGEMIIWIRKG